MRYVGGPADYATVEAALTNLLQTVGTDPFAVSHLVVVRLYEHAYDARKGVSLDGANSHTFRGVRITAVRRRVYGVLPELDQRIGFVEGALGPDHGKPFTMDGLRSSAASKRVFGAPLGHHMEF